MKLPRRMTTFERSAAAVVVVIALFAKRPRLNAGRVAALVVLLGLCWLVGLLT